MQEGSSADELAENDTDGEQPMPATGITSPPASYTQVESVCMVLLRRCLLIVAATSVICDVARLSCKHAFCCSCHAMHSSENRHGGIQGNVCGLNSCIYYGLSWLQGLAKVMHEHTQMLHRRV